MTWTRLGHLGEAVEVQPPETDRQSHRPNMWPANSRSALDPWQWDVADCMNHCLTKIKILACPLASLHVSSTCLKLFWTSPKFGNQEPNKPSTFSTTLACPASDLQNLLAGQENQLAPNCGRHFLSSPDEYNQPTVTDTSKWTDTPKWTAPSATRFSPSWHYIFSPPISRLSPLCGQLWLLHSERTSSSYFLHMKNLSSLDCVRLQLDHNAYCAYDTWLHNDTFGTSSFATGKPFTL